MHVIKQTTLLLIALIGLISACRQNDTVGSTNLLNKRWRLIESRLADGSLVPLGQSINTVVFDRSGEYINELNGRRFTCCLPNHFEQVGNLLLLSYKPGGYQSPECAYIDCVGFPPERLIQHIDVLSAKTLILSVRGSSTRSVYQAD
ncbi:hypothetical protein [Spirosoma montaniterrae]|uniref:Lipocalin-like domain-containing protein n=1 Tax=Spirosoma montaniterrae TaxID=1178516 RepID=A0A1P9X3L2_9BACT|nr:hypothetical protein [Spirosoma montaniterrae]AQG82197.1 hypothetical protein AWR27_24620 [Spirosoma montaniterrae]